MTAPIRLYTSVSLDGYIAKIASDLAAFEPVLRCGADHEIVTTAPIPVVASRVEQLTAVR